MGRPPEYERMLNSLRAFIRLIGRSSDGADVIELDGVVGSVCPSVPDRSLPNSVIYESQEALIDALPELWRRYDEAGVQAWTVWTPADDSEAIAALDEAGHKLDADPTAMTIGLATLGEPPDIDYRTGDHLIPVIGSINDCAYPVEDDPFTRMMSRHPPGVTSNYVADVDGEPAACLQILPVDGDALVLLVATVPDARGRGLASRLMLRALCDAREDGCDLSTLQATKLGEPVYARMGYESLGPIQMWEKRP